MDITAAVLSAMGTQAPFTDSKPLAVERIRLDRPGPGEVLVRIGGPTPVITVVQTTLAG